MVITSKRGITKSPIKKSLIRKKRKAEKLARRKNNRLKIKKRAVKGGIHRKGW